MPTCCAAAVVPTTRRATSARAVVPTTRRATSAMAAVPTMRRATSAMVAVPTTRRATTAAAAAPTTGSKSSAAAVAPTTAPAAPEPRLRAATRHPTPSTVPDADQFRAALGSAVSRLLKPLIRVLLRQSLPFAAFEDLAKRVYVDVALNEFGIPGKKATTSRVSVLSGLTRKDVQRLLADQGEGKAAVGEGYNRAARVLTAWTRDADFIDADGAPRVLDASEGEASFAVLVKRHSGDMPARAVLDELVRVGAVKRRDDKKLELLTRAYVPQTSATDKLAILGTDVADLIATIDHNIEHGGSDPRFQRKVMYHSIPAAAVPEFRRRSAEHAQALLEEMDRWLADHDTPNPPDAPQVDRKRVGLGIYYFEDAAEKFAAKEP
jgi:Family of unknown function (DUF6502)